MVPSNRGHERRARRLLEFCVAYRLDHDVPSKRWADGTKLAKEHGTGACGLATFLVRHALNDLLIGDAEPWRLDESARYLMPEYPGRKLQKAPLQERLEPIVHSRLRHQSRRGREALSEAWARYITNPAVDAQRPGSEADWASLWASSPLAQLWAAEREVSVPEALETPETEHHGAELLPLPEGRLAELWLVVLAQGRRTLIALFDEPEPVAWVYEFGAGIARRTSLGTWWTVKAKGTDGKITCKTNIAVGHWTFVLELPAEGDVAATCTFTSDESTVDPVLANWFLTWHKAWGEDPSTSLEVPSGGGIAYRLRESVWPAPGSPRSEFTGDWLKLSAAGGTFLVSAKEEGWLTERPVLGGDPAAGKWWLDETPAKRKFHVWVGYWMVRLCEDPADQSRDFKNLKAPIVFVRPPALQCFAHCLEQEPRTQRWTEFLVARVAPRAPA